MKDSTGPTPEFIFTTCQHGAEAVLKHEIAREWPTFKFSYSRPGFLTFKVTPDADVSAGFDLRSIFARAYGISLGKAKGDTLPERATFTAMVARQSLPKRLRLNVWEREREDPSRRPPDDDGAAQDGARSDLLKEVEAAIRGVQDGLFHDEPCPQDGDTVFSVVLVEPDEWWMGYHLHTGYHRPWSGGVAHIELPPEAPSRAYLKLREGLKWPGLPVKTGDRVLELGSAPGGASYALLEMGLKVVGVDPAEMSPTLLAHPGYGHVTLQSKQLTAADLEKVGGNAFDWICCDINLSGKEMLDAVEKVLTVVSQTRLMGALLTLKLTNWTTPEAVPETVRRSMERCNQIGFSRAQSAQLHYNRREVCIACFTEKGEAKFFSHAARNRPHGSGAGARKKRS